MNRNPVKNEYTGLEIAVIGMSCRFPGANNIEEFWENLENGVESMHFFNEEEIKNSSTPKSYLDNQNFIPARGTLENPGYFDAAFFGYKPIEAEFMDPQFRFF
jgi:acyl transferase domain-containing protein